MPVKQSSQRKLTLMCSPKVSSVLVMVVMGIYGPHHLWQQWNPYTFVDVLPV